MTQVQLSSILELIDLKIQLASLTNRADQRDVRDRINDLEDALRDSIEDEE